MDFERKLVEPGLLSPSPWNPRQIDESDPSLDELAADIKAKTQYYPCIVRPHPNQKKRFEIVAGERRWRACKKHHLNVYIEIRDLDDKQAIEITVSENLQREELSPLEEARGISTLLSHGWSAEEAADRFGKSVRWVQRRARLNRLVDKWRKLAADPASPVHRWSALMLEDIAALEPASQEQLLDKTKFSLAYIHGREGLQREISHVTHELRKAVFPIDARNLPGGSCLECDKRASCRPHLFEDVPTGEDAIKKGDQCLDHKCWEKKEQSHVKREVRKAEKEHGKKLVKFTERGGLGHGVNVKYSWEVKKVDPETKGAKPAVNVDTGDVVYVTAPAARTARSSTPRQRPARELRLEYVCDQFEKLWRKNTQQTSLQQLATVAAAFGTYSAVRVKGRLLQGPEAFEHIAGDGQRIRQALADGIWETFQDEYAYVLNDDGKDPAFDCLAKVARIDMDKLRADALAKYPDPVPKQKQSRSAKKAAAAKEAA